MSLPLSPEQRAQKWGTILRWGAFALAGYLVAPIIMATITGMLGLIVAAGIAGGVWYAMPVLHTMGANMRLRMLKAEAARDPISTLENEHLRRTQLLQERKAKIETLAAKTAGFGSKLAQFKRDYPTEAGAYQEIYDKMVLLLKRSRDQWVVAEKQLDAFAGEIEKAKAKWAMALAAADLRQDASKVEAEFLAKLKVNYSFEAIESGMNQAFAQLDTLLMESDAVEINVTGTAQAALPAPASTAIPVEVLSSDKAKVR